MSACPHCEYGVEYTRCTCGTDPAAGPYPYDWKAAEDARAREWQRVMDEEEDARDS